MFDMKYDIYDLEIVRPSLAIYQNDLTYSVPFKLAKKFLKLYQINVNRAKHAFLIRTHSYAVVQC